MGKLYAPLITNNTKNEEYFAFAVANRDGLQHFDGIVLMAGVRGSLDLVITIRRYVGAIHNCEHFRTNFCPTSNPNSQPTPVPDNRTRYNLIQGDNLNNKLKGTSKNDEIYGCVGRDKIKGRRGDDIIDPGLSKAGRFDIVEDQRVLILSLSKMVTGHLLKTSILLMTLWTYRI